MPGSVCLTIVEVQAATNPHTLIDAHAGIPAE